MTSVTDRINDLKLNGKKQVIPRVLNQGPRGVPNIFIRMYKGSNMVSEENFNIDVIRIYVWITEKSRGRNRVIRLTQGERMSLFLP